ncbi:MAG: hypothetical protein ACK4R9_12680 [Ignavibacterium sp.]
MEVELNKMNKYAYTLFKEIQSFLEEENAISFDTKIADIFSEDFDELSWLMVLIKIELIYGLDIPDELAGFTHLTIMEFSNKLSTLTVIPKAIYPEFYDLKIQMLDLIIRRIKIIEGLEEGTEQELLEIIEKLKEIEQRLKQITEFPNN